MGRWIVLVSITIASVVFFRAIATSQLEVNSESHVDISDGWEDIKDDDTDVAVAAEITELVPPKPQDLLSAFSRNKTKKGSLILVSTLDGRLSALDEQNEGNLLWSLATGPSGLLSSSISKVELSSQGQWVRLIPSLHGGLYKFDGDAIEPIPITAETLLHSSFQLSDELIITGGKESRTYGLDARTGRLQYVCTLQGCQTTSEQVTSSGEFLIIRRHTQTVRAVEPRTGMERWNFSVGQHDVVVLDSNSDTFVDCDEDGDGQENSVKSFECRLKDIVDSAEIFDAEYDTDSSATSKPPNTNLKVVVPDGVVIGVDSSRPSKVRWQQKFESPVVKIWRMSDGQLVELDLFSIQEQPEVTEGSEVPSPPMLYVGIHNKQLYVQENPKLLSVVSVASQQEAALAGSVHQKGSPRPRLPWKPKNAQSLPELTGRPGRFTITSTETDESRTEPIAEDDSRITALVVRHDTDYPFDRGFYLYGEKSTEKPLIEDKSETTSTKSPTDDEEWWEGGSGTTVHIVIVSLWFWWREVVFISLFTAVLFHVLITRQVVFLLRQRWAVELQRHLVALLPTMAQAMMERQRAQQQQREQQQQQEQQQETPERAGDSGDAFENVVVVQSQTPAIPAPITPPASPEYTSRYLTDFEPVQCLGRGGFGLVFEARNRLDDCHYAVKRIQLPNSDEAREKVMREVRALAKLDHPHIVRYFHAWLECPPPGWQEQKDLQWIDCENLTGPTPNNTAGDDDLSVTFSESRPRPNNPLNPFIISSSQVSLNNNKRIDDSFDIVFEKTRSNDPTSDSSIDIVFENGDSGTSEISDKDSLVQWQSGSDGFSRMEESSLPSLSRSRARSDSSLKPKKTRAFESKMFLYIQMQLCRKDSLREWLRTHVNHRDLFQVLHMFNEIIQAVEYVHLQGLMHRDLKPSNIFFAPDGSIKVGDFGLVTAMSDDTSRSPAGEIPAWFPPDAPSFKHTDQVGTQLYMSPEQIEGKPYNHKVDIYSLGLIFFELLWPFSTQMEQVNTLSQLRRLKFPHGFAEKYPEEHRLLRTMLSPNPDERPTTFGVRLSPPLVNLQEDNLHDIPEYLRFSLQRPRSTTRTSSSSSSQE